MRPLPLRLAVLAAAMAFAAAAAPPALAQGATPVAAVAERPDAQDLARWMYAVLTGEIAAVTGHPAVAYTELLDAARNMNSEALYERACEVALAAGAPDQALVAANAWRAAQPDSPKALDWVAQLLIAQGRISEAAAALSRLIALSPEPQRPVVVLAASGLFSRVADPAQALELARKTLEPYAALPQSAVVIGQQRARAGDPAGALESAAQALGRAPGLTAAAVLLLQNYKADPQRADALMARFEAAHPDDVELRVAWVDVALEQERSAVAYDQARVVADLRPSMPEIWLVLGSLQLQDEQLADARQSLQKYLDLLGQAKPAAAPAAFARGDLLLAEIARKQQDYADAEAWLRKVPAGVEDDARALQAAILEALQWRLAAAVERINALPGHTAQQRRQRRLALAELYGAVHQYGQAHRVLAAGLESSGTDPDYLYQTAMAAERAGRRGEMETLLRRIIRDHKNFQEAYNALGFTLADQNRQLPEANRLVARALKLAPGNPFILDSMGWVMFREGDLVRAQALLEQALAARRDPEIMMHLAEVLWHRGDQPRARDLAHQAWQRAPHDDAVRAALERMGLEFN